MPVKSIGYDRIFDDESKEKRIRRCWFKIASFKLFVFQYLLTFKLENFLFLFSYQNLLHGFANLTN